MLLTAHHAQDQTETILLKLLRGTGIKGLAGMSKLRKFAHGYLARPLLDYSPEILKAYLNQNDISWINDESNYNNDYKRNYLRNNILPFLKQQFTHPIKNINRSAKNSQHSLELLNHLADFQGNCLSIQKLTALPNHLQATMLYHWLSLKNLPTPDTATLKQITDDFIHAAMDKHPHYQNSYYQLYRWQDAVYCIQNFEIIDSESEFAWNTEMPFELPNGCGKLEYTGNKSLNLVIKFKQTGQKIQTHKHAFRKSTKQLLQENKISPWQRQNTPFIYLNKELISLGYDWSNSKEFQDNITFNLHRFNI
jgi:tRNA(Ile)-lysidine synthase